MFFWNNILSLLIGGKYLYVLSHILFYFRCLWNVGKGERQKTILQIPWKKWVPDRKILNLGRKAKIDVENSHTNNYIVRVLSSRPVVQLCMHVCAFGIIFYNKVFWRETFVYVKFTCDLFLSDALKMTSFEKWPKENCQPWKEGKNWCGTPPPPRHHH